MRLQGIPLGRDGTLHEPPSRRFSRRRISLSLTVIAVVLQITGDPVKLGLGAASLVFDAVMMVQHYILYGPKDVSYERLEDDRCIWTTHRPILI